MLHREDGGGAHVHVLATQCDLETGRSINIAPPGWRKTFDPLRDAFNHERGWSRPDDPAPAKVEQRIEPLSRTSAPGGGDGTRRDPRDEVLTLVGGVVRRDDLVDGGPGRRGARGALG